jgi:multidrug resistance efflux pump
MRAGEGRSGAMVILALAPGGKLVKKGETVLEIDPGWLQDHIDDIEDSIRAARNDINKRQAEQAVEWENLQQTLRTTRATLEKARLDARASEVRTEVERELLRLNVEEAEARYRQQERDLAQRKEAHAAELQILKLTETRHVRHRDRHLNDLTRFQVKAPMDGLVVLATTFRGGEMSQIALGDQVGPGQQVLKIVEPGSMQLDANINQAETGMLRIGQKVRVGFDAFPGLTLPGRVFSVGALAVGGWRQQNYIRTVPVKIAFDQLDERVIPDLSAHADVILERAEATSKVPRSAVGMEGNQPFLFVRSGDQFVKRPVQLGLFGNTEVAVTEGVKPGEQIRLGVDAAVSAPQQAGL